MMLLDCRRCRSKLAVMSWFILMLLVAFKPRGVNGEYQKQYGGQNRQYQQNGANQQRYGQYQQDGANNQQQQQQQNGANNQQQQQQQYGQYQQYQQNNNGADQQQQQYGQNGQYQQRNDDGQQGQYAGQYGAEYGQYDAAAAGEFGYDQYNYGYYSQQQRNENITYAIYNGGASCNGYGFKMKAFWLDCGENQLCQLDDGSMKVYAHFSTEYEMPFAYYTVKVKACKWWGMKCIDLPEQFEIDLCDIINCAPGNHTVINKPVVLYGDENSHYDYYRYHYGDHNNYIQYEYYDENAKEEEEAEEEEMAEEGYDGYGAYGGGEGYDGYEGYGGGQGYEGYEGYREYEEQMRLCEEEMEAEGYEGYEDGEGYEGYEEYGEYYGEYEEMEEGEEVEGEEEEEDMEEGEAEEEGSERDVCGGYDDDDDDDDDGGGRGWFNLERDVDMWGNKRFHNYFSNKWWWKKQWRKQRKEDYNDWKQWKQAKQAKQQQEENYYDRQDAQDGKRGYYYINGQRQYYGNWEDSQDGEGYGYNQAAQNGEDNSNDQGDQSGQGYSNDYQNGEAYDEEGGPEGRVENGDPDNQVKRRWIWNWPTWEWVWHWGWPWKGQPDQAGQEEQQQQQRPRVSDYYNYNYYQNLNNEQKYNVKQNNQQSFSQRQYYYKQNYKIPQGGTDYLKDFASPGTKISLKFTFTPYTEPIYGDHYGRKYLNKTDCDDLVGDKYYTVMYSSEYLQAVCDEVYKAYYSAYQKAYQIALQEIQTGSEKAGWADYYAYFYGDDEVVEDEEEGEEEVEEEYEYEIEDGHYDEDGYWVEGRGHYDEDGSWVDDEQERGHYDDYGNWVAEGYFDADGTWVEIDWENGEQPPVDEASLADQVERNLTKTYMYIYAQNYDQTYRYPNVACTLPLKIVSQDFDVELWSQSSSYKTRWKTFQNAFSYAVSMVGLLGLSVWGMKRRRLACREEKNTNDDDSAMDMDEESNRKATDFVLAR